MKINVIEIWKERGAILEGVKNRIFKQEHVEEIAERRLAVCRTCEYYGKNSDDCMIVGTHPCCKHCGCCLAFKSRALSASCDLGFWDAIVTENEEDMINEQIEQL